MRVVMGFLQCDTLKSGTKVLLYRRFRRFSVGWGSSRGAYSSGRNIGAAHRGDHRLGKSRRAVAAAQIRSACAVADGPFHAVLELLRGSSACRLTRPLVQPVQQLRGRQDEGYRIGQTLV